MTAVGGFHADEGVIAGVPNILRSGSNSLEQLGGAVPPPPDAGKLSAVMGSLMAKLVDAAGEVSTGAAAAAAAVEQGAKVYVESDQAAENSLPQVK